MDSSIRLGWHFFSKVNTIFQYFHDGNMGSYNKEISNVNNGFS